MRVEDIMTHEVQSCRPDETLEHAAQLMWDGDFGVVPIVDGERRVVGMLTDRDICMSAYLQGLPLARILVSSAASRGAFSIRRDDPVTAAEAEMRVHRVRRLPVVDDAGHLVGIVALHDLARHYRGGWGRDATNADDLARTLSVISEPRDHIQHAAE